MNDAPPQPDAMATSSTSADQPQTTSELPPEAIALATRFFDGARNGQMDIFEQALPSGLPANLTNDKGDTLLMLAAYHGHAPLVSLLLKHGADPNRLNDRGQSPLAGVVFKHEAECIKVLLDGGADPEIGTPSALASTQIFKQQDYEALFRAQIEKLRAHDQNQGQSQSQGQGQDGDSGAINEASS